MQGKTETRRLIAEAKEASIRQVGDYLMFLIMMASITQIYNDEKKGASICPKELAVALRRDGGSPEPIFAMGKLIAEGAGVVLKRQLRELRRVGRAGNIQHPKEA